METEIVQAWLVTPAAHRLDISRCELVRDGDGWSGSSNTISLRPMPGAVCRLELGDGRAGMVEIRPATDRLEFVGVGPYPR